MQFILLALLALAAAAPRTLTFLDAPDVREGDGVLCYAGGPPAALLDVTSITCTSGGNGSWACATDRAEIRSANVRCPEEGAGACKLLYRLAPQTTLQWIFPVEDSPSCRDGRSVLVWAVLERLFLAITAPIWLPVLLVFGAAFCVCLVVIGIPFAGVVACVWLLEGAIYWTVRGLDQVVGPDHLFALACAAPLWAMLHLYLAHPPTSRVRRGNIPVYALVATIAAWASYHSV